MVSPSNLPARRESPAARYDPISLGETMARSGYFADARDGAQAAVKMLAGAELGIGPVASMTGIHIVQGRVTLSANLIAACVKRSGRYTYRVIALEPERCEIAYYESGEEIGRSAFTRADAEQAGLWAKTGPWKQHPRNMLYARAMSNGAKWYTPDVFAGPVYTPDELGVAVDGETGEVIAAQAPTALTDWQAAPPAPEPAPAHDWREGWEIVRRTADSLGFDEDGLREHMAALNLPGGAHDLADPDVVQAAVESLEATSPVMSARESSGRREPDDHQPPESPPAPPGQTTLGASA